MKSKEEILDDKIQEQNGRYTSSVLPTNSTVESFKIRFADDEKEFIHSVMEYYADQFRPKWISVEERIPDSDRKVLVLMKSSPKTWITTIASFYGEKHGWSSTSGLWFKVAYWMEIIEPPKP
ncbi:MAG TPA: DUF551 domain-containing protein [Cyclobacteriaceae bacterium]